MLREKLELYKPKANILIDEIHALKIKKVCLVQNFSATKKKLIVKNVQIISNIKQIDKQFGK